VRSLLVSGGVAANSLLRSAFEVLGSETGIPAVFPSLSLSTDNAAMIAAAGYVKLQRREFARWDLNADVALRLGDRAGRRSHRHK
jgi:N6-L-threonylcarbamoyladenine synthase